MDWNFDTDLISCKFLSPTTDIIKWIWKLPYTDKYNVKSIIIKNITKPNYYIVGFML